MLADSIDNQTLHRITEGESVDPHTQGQGHEGISQPMAEAFLYLSRNLSADLSPDPFKRLGLWTDFITNRLEFAVFMHPDPASAYRVFEVINTRGRELTAADLLKNYLLSQTTKAQQQVQYQRWQTIARTLAASGSNTLVQYIRHVMTVRAGYVRPKELFDYIARRIPSATPPPAPGELVDVLEEQLPLYVQMVDPTLPGPATPTMLRIFAAFNDLNVIVVRPLLIATAEVDGAELGMERVLDIVVRRIVVGNLGTGNVERRFSEAAAAVHANRDWDAALAALRDLDPRRDEFVAQLDSRSLNKGTLQFMRRSVVQGTKTPDPTGWLHFVRPRQSATWDGFDDEDLTYWGSTLGNSILIRQQRRPAGAGDWQGAKENLLPLAVDGEWVEHMLRFESWGAEAVERIGRALAEAASAIWY